MIEIGRTSIIVRNVDFESKEYKNALYKYSVYDKVQHKYTFSAFSVIGNDLYFPASITADNIQKIFPNKELCVNFKNTAKTKTLTYKMKHQPRNKLQKDAIAFLMKMKLDPVSHQRFLSLETGSGKTYVTINCISQFKKKAMIIVDTLDLADQWKREFLKHTDLSESQIIILSGQESIDKECANPQGSVYIAIHRTLDNMLLSDSNSINVLMNKLGIGVRVFDESHVYFGSICKINALSNIEYTIYLTATPSRSKYTEDTLYAKIFQNIAYFNGKEMSEKYHTVILYKMNSHPSLDDRIAVRTQYGFNQALWSQYICEDGYEFFLEAVNDILKIFKLTERGKKVAIMLPTIEIIKKLKIDLESIGIDKDKIGTFIGEIPKAKRIEQLQKQFILTNDKIFDKGIDVPDLEILINFVPIGNAVKTEQIIGRLRNREGYLSILIDVTDEGFDECKRQSNIRKRFYKKKAKKIIEIENKKD